MEIGLHYKLGFSHPQRWLLLVHLCLLLKQTPLMLCDKSLVD